jgi:hypothetical protein
MQPWIGELPLDRCAEPPEGAEPYQLGNSAG